MGHRAYIIERRRNGKWYYRYSHWGAEYMWNADYGEKIPFPNEEAVEFKLIGDYKALETFIDTAVDVFIEAVWIDGVCYYPLIIEFDLNDNLVLLLRCDYGADVEISETIKESIDTFNHLANLMFDEETAKILTILFTIRIIGLRSRTLFSISDKKLNELHKKYYKKLEDYMYLEKDKFADMVKKMALLDKVTKS